MLYFVVRIMSARLLYGLACRINDRLFFGFGSSNWEFMKKFLKNDSWWIDYDIAVSNNEKIKRKILAVLMNYYIF